MKRPHFSTRSGAGGEKASALMLVLWALFILTAAVLAWAKWIDQDIALANQANRDVEARAMAHSGLAMALHPLVSLESSQLEKDFDSSLGYKVRMVGEGGKLNINWLLAGEDPRKLDILRRWLAIMDLDFQQTEALIDCLLDYVDADSLKRLNGAEDEDDYHPANRPLLSIDELLQVRGCEPLVQKAGWRESLTIYSGGPIDLLAAPPEVLRALPGLGDAMVSRFVAFRAGKDGLLGTEDDPPFKNLRDVQLFLGMSDAQFKQWGSLVTVKDQVTRIISVGHSGKGIRQVEVVARKGGPNPAILYWNE